MNYSICVSGAAAGETVEGAHDLALRLGVEIAKSGHIITTGATVGLPMFAARAAKDVGGRSIGFSPASSLREHVNKYRLPIGFFDYVVYTGMNYVGRDVFLVQSSDAVITVGGRFGSLHEFTTALESRMVCGVLLESGGAADVIPELMKQLPAPNEKLVIFDTNPERLVQKVVAMLNQDMRDINTKAIEQEWYVKSSSGTHAG
jgi:hypothetical protein